MKLTCLSRGNGFHFPPCYIFTLCEFKILVDCPIDLSALTIFSPIPTGFYQAADFDVSDISMKESCFTDSNEPKRRKIENPLQASDLICAEPWYKTVTNLNLWDITFIDFVLITSPMGMLGLPFLTRNNKFSAKIYATEATARLGKLMMDDLVSMHMEFRQYYGPEEFDSPQWMRWEKLELLPLALRNIAMGEDGADLASWQPLYSAENVKDCLQKVQTLKYAEETCYNGTLNIKAFSSGLEIGTSNWTISSPRRSIVCLSSSIFESAHAMNFDYRSLQRNDVILFSDLSHLHGAAIKDVDGNRSLRTCQAPTAYDFSDFRDGNDNEQEFIKSVVNTDESSEEMDKLAFICSHAIDSVKAGGSVLVPFGRLGVVLQLLEQVSLSLESSNLKVPIFIVSAVAEEILAFTNVVPEWLCRQRQEKLYSGEALFGHVELIRSKKLHLFPTIHSPDFLMMWQEPCIVFSPHWSLRLGPVVHFLRRWSGDHNSLLVLEQGVDADLALLPFKPVAIKVLQCSFLSGIKIEKVQPLLKILQPKLVLFPEDLRLQIPCSSTNSLSFLHYSLNKPLRVPSFRKDHEANLTADLAFQLEPRRTKQENMAIARLRGKLFIDNGKYVLVSSKEPIVSSEKSIPMHWGSPDPGLLLVALHEKGVNGSIGRDRSVLEIHEPSKALIETHSTHTVVSTDDKFLASLIFEAMSSVLDGI